VVRKHGGFHLVSIAVGKRSAAAARRDSSGDEPPARATSATSNRWGRYAVGEAIRSLWPDSEFHEESLPAMPVLVLTRVLPNGITDEALDNR